MVTSDMATLEDLLHGGFIPVLHGDCVRDKTRGFGILSGDSIVEVGIASAGQAGPCYFCNIAACSLGHESCYSAIVRVWLAECCIALSTAQTNAFNFQQQ